MSTGLTTPIRFVPVACALVLGALCEGQQPRPRNVVFVLADDVGVGDIGCYHRQRTGRDPVAPTPNLDALAVAGMRFADAHSSTALCSPTRYSVMCGNLPHRSYAPWGVWGSFRPTPFTERDATLGRVGKQAGLSTAFLGKWHLGGDFLHRDGDGVYRGNDRGDEPIPVDASRIVAGGPASLGFDYSFTLPCGIQGPLYVAYENGLWSPLAEGSKLIHYDADSAPDPRFVSDKGPGIGDSAWDPREVGKLLSSRAVDFMRRSAEANRPFLLYYCSPMVHVPHIAPREFDGKPVRGATPSAHLDMMVDLDQQVGRLVAELKRSGEYDQTLFVFTSDNGGLIDRLAEASGHHSSNGVRGSKNQAYEGGHRVPLLVVWPERIARGVESHRVVTAHDFVATIAGLFGQRLNEDQAMDSLDLTSLLLDRGDPTAARPDVLLQGGSRLEVIYRSGPWKLIIDTDAQCTYWEPTGLFNLVENPNENETANLVNSPQYADRVNAMLERYRELRTSGERTAPLSTRDDALSPET